ncbi:MAG: hypothetical protein N7Q72_00570 [Spiroplasma sp. Tabriz.8]|nr:hypothetical protein [Candidatus Karelsulcia muelleri]MCZ8631735.1 hypothetical protein [Spiroplasma sp. Tabriz.8]
MLQVLLLSISFYLIYIYIYIYIYKFLKLYLIKIIRSIIIIRSLFSLELKKFNFNIY